MDRYKLKWTGVEQQIVKQLCTTPTTTYNAYELARILNVSPTAIGTASKRLAQKEIATVYKKGTLHIKLNRERKEVFQLKRIINLKEIYESNILNTLTEHIPGATIILFGSYAHGEDTEQSDIDIAIIGYTERKIILSTYEKKLNRAIQLHWFKKQADIPKNLYTNILNGIVIEGAIE